MSQELRLTYFLWIAIGGLAQFPTPNEYPQRVGGRCGFLQFDCDPSTRTALCVRIEAVRDCVADCPNRSDEWCPKGQVLCDTHVKCGKCVSPHEMHQKCLDRKWQHLCAYQGTIKCATNQNCVFATWLMDGKDDCGDGSDEDVCARGLIRCDGPDTTSHATPVTVVTVTAIGNVTSANRTRDFVLKDRCEIGEFRCLNGECVKVDRVLDGIEDCEDGSDENYCEENGEGCRDSAPCAFQPDISAFSCGCAKGFQVNKAGICVLEEREERKRNQ